MRKIGLKYKETSQNKHCLIIGTLLAIYKSSL